MFPLSSRRESERRNHSLARHADILAAVETRLSLLNMTFMKYVDSNLCCFIPGKVSVAATGKQLCSISSFQDRREKFSFKKLIFSFCSKSTLIHIYFSFLCIQFMFYGPLCVFNKVKRIHALVFAVTCYNLFLGLALHAGW